MKMTVLRAVRSKEMDVDISHCTEVSNVERDDEQFVTIYGTEENGQLYYIVLDQAVVDKIRTI
ncbi:hypothetical protein LCGC14_1101620 [marine sediment metagenome]|uniref:Uncharacterized protein n=1 Tax=marine sediment metagenome TaxID=412755 RepID=A0A0F9M990_9ZZZZ